MATSIAVPLALAVSELAGSDGAAQVARADHWAAHPLAPLDLRWFGGVSGWGYSLLTPPLVAAVGTRIAGALCAIAAATALACLLSRAQVRRPTLGAVVGAVALCGNLPTGRTAFALGTALGLGALVAAQAARRGLTVLAAVATSLASPVAGLFLGLTGVAWALTGRRRPGLEVASAAGAVLLLVQLCYGDGGQMPFAWPVAWPPLVAAAAVGLLAGPRNRALAVGAGLYAAGVLLTYRWPGSLGSNVERLALLFAAPLLAATAELPVRLTPPGPAGPWRRPLAAGLLVALCAAPALWWQAKVPLRDLRRSGAELTEPDFRPLLGSLPADPAGRVEVVPLRNHAEAAVVARHALLARGWSRQVDEADNPLLYGGPLDPDAYRRWLDERAVHYVALADGPLDWSAGPESALLAHPPAYLEPVPVSGPWHLWRVLDPRPLVDGDARVLAADGAGVTLAAAAPGTVLLRLRWSPLLSVRQGAACLMPAPGPADDPGARWVRVRLQAAGVVRVGSDPLPLSTSSCSG